MKKIFIAFLISQITVSCEKQVNINYKENQSAIIIEGNITNQIGPYYVKITKSIPLASLDVNPTIDNAVVTISDDAGTNDILVSQGNGLYKTNSILGIPGRTYTLTVNAENKQYTAQSKMPQRVQFDSIKQEKFSIIGETEYNIIPIYIDPINNGNNYRFILTLNNKLINQHFIQTDEIRNGLVNSFRIDYNDEKNKLKVGDQLKVAMQCIDHNVTKYYTTLALMNDNGPGGGTTPSNPPSNISNGALGLFSAHTIEIKQHTIY